MNNSEFLSINEAAKILGVHSETLRRWDKSGRLKATRLGNKQGVGARKYLKKDVEMLLEGINKPLLETPSDSNTNFQPLSWLSNRQRNIWGRLKKRNPTASDAYAGSLRSFKDTSNPDRFAQSAHALREISYLIAPDIAEAEKDKDNENKMRLRIEEFLNSQDLGGGLPDDIRIKAARQWVDTHNWFVKVSHHGFLPTEEEFIRRRGDLELILENLMGKFYSSLDKIDGYTNLPNPTKQNVEDLGLYIKKYAQYDYFFRELSKPGWLELLQAESYFDKPIDVKKASSGFQYRDWPPAKYLANIASQRPERVAEIINSTAKVENSAVHSDFIKAALSIPATYSKNLIKKIRKENWLTGQYFRMTDLGGDLLAKFADEGEPEAACEIAWILLDFREKDRGYPKTKEFKNLRSIEAESVIDGYEYTKILTERMPKVTEQDPLLALKILKNLLSKAIRINTGAENFSNDGFINLLRPSLDAKPRSRFKEPINSLIDTIIWTLDLIAQKKPSNLKSAVESLKGKSGTYPIFTRIILHTYKKYPTFFVGEIKDGLLNHEYFNDNKLDEEFSSLLESSFQNFSVGEKNRFLMMFGKIDLKNLENSWVLRRLPPIKSYLSKGWIKTASHVEQKIKPRSHDRPMESSWVEMKSPMDEARLEKMRPKEIVDFLIEWKPNTKSGKNSEGLGRALEKRAGKDTGEFVNLLPDLLKKKARTTYIYYILRGINSAVATGFSINWGEWLGFLKTLVSKDHYPYDKEESFFSNTEWIDIRRFIAGLFNNSLQASGIQIPFNQRSIVWEILEILGEDPEPSKDYENENLTPNNDADMISINTVRGEAVHTTIEYALWCQRNIGSEDKPTLVPEVKKYLDRHLDLKHEPTLTIHSVYGFHFPQLFYLDRNWARKKIQNIFPLPFNQPLTQVAWESYLTFGTRWIPSIKALRNEYEKAVRNLKGARPGDHLDNLAEHLMILYLRGDLKISDRILVNFFANANDETKAHAVWYLWRFMKEKKPADNSDYWQRLKIYWLARLDKPSLGGKSKEISTFAYWLSSAPENVGELKDLISKTLPFIQLGGEIRHIVEYLLTQADTNLKVVSELLLSLVSISFDEFRYATSNRELREILLKMLSSKSPYIRSMGHKVINIFGERGDSSFRDLIKNQNKAKPTRKPN